MVNSNLDRDIAWSEETMQQFVSSSTKMLDEMIKITQSFAWQLTETQSGINSMPAQDVYSPLQEALSALQGHVMDDNANATKNKIERVFKSVLSDAEKADADLATSVDEVGENFNKVAHNAIEITNVLRNPINVVNQAKLSAALEIVKRNCEKNVSNIDISLDAISKHLMGAYIIENYFSADPVNLSTGNFIYDNVDLSIGGEVKLSFHRYYNSLDRVKTTLGRCFVHNYDNNLIINDNIIEVRMFDGRRKLFEKRDNNEFVAMAATKESLQIKNDVYIMKNLLGYVWKFDQEGRIIRDENAIGRGRNYNYDKNGNLSKVVADTGAFLEYAYDNDLLVNVRDCFGRNVNLSYDNGKLVKVTLPGGATYDYQYGESGRITEINNSRDVRAVVNTYDDRNRVTHQEFPDGSSMDFTYDDDNGVVILRERNGSIIKYVHDSKYRATDAIYEDGTSEHFEYNDRNQRISIKNRNGNVTRYAYDDRGNVTQVINAKNEKTSITYNSFNKITSVKINGREKFKNVYDAKGNLVEAINSLGGKTLMSYNKNEKPVEIINADGSKTKVSYDERGNITKIDEASGKCIKYEYDELNRVIKTTDSKGNSTSYEYNEAGMVSKSVNKEGNARSFVYNEAGMVTEVTDYDGFKNNASYNEIGKLSSVTDKEGNTTTYSYDSMWNVSNISIPNGGNVVHTYDKNNRLKSVTLPEGGVIYYDYDANGNRTAVTDPEGATTTYKYDELNRIIKVVDANGKSISRAYDDNGKLVKKINQAGVATEYSYDSEGRLTSKKDGLGYVTSYEYDVMGRLIKKTYPNGAVERREYRAGRLSKHIFADGTFKCYEYDANGNCVKTIDNMGNTVLMEYNAMDKVVKAINPEGNALSYEYDAVGNVICVTDARNNKTLYSYTPNGKVSRVVDAKGFVTEYAYDCMGNLITISRYGNDNEVQTTSYEWNLEGKLLKTTDSLGMSESFEYDKCGRVTRKLDKDGYSTDYAYNKLGLIEKILYADGTDVELCYDELRKLREVKDATGTTVIENDELGRVLSVTDSDGKTTSYEWGPQGERTAVIYPDGTRAQYSFNESKLESLSTSKGTVSYIYDELGRVSEKKLPNDIVTRYTYNPSGRIASISHVGSDFTDSFVYGYDEVGNKTSINKSRSGIEGESFSFEYDELNRIVKVSKDEEILRKYEYDSYGNRKLMENFEEDELKVTEYTYNVHNQLVESVCGGNKELYRYDGRGNLAEVEVNNKIIKSFTFDSANRMSMAQSIVDGRLKRSEYRYNVRGQRISQDIFEEDELARKLKYTVDMTRNYNDLLSIDEIVGADDVNVKDFFWDTNVVAMEENGIDSFYLQDDLGSPFKLTDDAGQIRESYSFDEFGKADDEIKNNLQPFGFTGYQMDEVTGLYFAQARRYDSNNGRFVSEDLVSGQKYNPISLNKYVYCWNRPLDYVDQNGKFPWLIIPVVIAVAVGLTACSDSSSIEYLPEHIPYSECGPVQRIEGYEPNHNMEEYNTEEYQIYTNCYAYAFGILNDPRTGEKLPQGGLQPGYLSNNEYYYNAYIDKVDYDETYADQEAYKAHFLAGTEESNANLVEVIKDDMDVVGMNFEEYEDGMTGGMRVALVVRQGDYHWYYYDEETGIWSNKHGGLRATDKRTYYDNLIVTAIVDYGDEPMTDYIEDMEYFSYELVGEFYITRQDGKCIQ